MVCVFKIKHMSAMDGAFGARTDTSHVAVCVVIRKDMYIARRSGGCAHILFTYNVHNILCSLSTPILNADTCKF